MAQPALHETLRPGAVTCSPGGPRGGAGTLHAATPLPRDVVPADDGVTDGVPERAAVEHCGVGFSPTGGSVGYDAAANAGMADRREGVDLVANPAVRFEPGAVEDILAVARRWPQPPRWEALDLAAPARPTGVAHADAPSAVDGAYGRMLRAVRERAGRCGRTADAPVAGGGAAPTRRTVPPAHRG